MIDINPNIYNNINQYTQIYQLKYYSFRILLIIWIFLLFFVITKIIINYVKIRKYNKNIKIFVDRLKIQYKDELNKKSWIIFIKSFIRYIELFEKKILYKNIKEILSSIWTKDKMIENIESIVYSNDEENIENVEWYLRKFIEEEL